MVERDDCMRGGAYDKGVMLFFTGTGAISPDYRVSIFVTHFFILLLISEIQYLLVHSL